MLLRQQLSYGLDYKSSCVYGIRAALLIESCAHPVKEGNGSQSFCSATLHMSVYITMHIPDQNLRVSRQPGRPFSA